MSGLKQLLPEDIAWRAVRTEVLAGSITIRR